MNNSIPSGVITGKDVQKIFKLAKEKKFAIPAVNVIGSNSINAVLETASKLKSPVIIQFSNGGAQFNAGKGLSNEDQKSAIAGAVAGAKHIHLIAEAYGVPVILHTDHAAKKLLPWIDGLLDASEKHFAETGKPPVTGDGKLCLNPPAPPPPPKSAPPPPPPATTKYSIVVDPVGCPKAVT